MTAMTSGLGGGTRAVGVPGFTTYGQGSAMGFGPTMQEKEELARRNSMQNWLMGQMGGLNTQSAGQSRPVKPPPPVTVGGVWSGPQIQGQVNAMRAGNEARAAGQTNRMQADMAGRGFGSRSPLALAMQGMIGGQTLAANTSGERQTRWDAAQGNAQQRLSSERARMEGWAEEQRAQTARDALATQTATQSRNAILAAMMGLM